MIMASESKHAGIMPIVPDGSGALPAFVVPRLLRIQDAAKYLSATTGQIETLLREKVIPSFVLGKRRVVDRLELDQMSNGEMLEGQKKRSEIRARSRCWHYSQCSRVTTLHPGTVLGRQLGIPRIAKKHRSKCRKDAVRSPPIQRMVSMSGNVRRVGVLRCVECGCERSRYATNGGVFEPLVSLPPPSQLWAENATLGP